MAFDEESINVEYERHIRDIHGLNSKLHEDISGIIDSPEDYDMNWVDEYGESDTDSCTEVLRNNANEHLHAILRVQEFAARDIKTVAEMERQSLLSVIEESGRLSERAVDFNAKLAADARLLFLEIKLKDEGDKAMYSFVNELCTIIDNVYLMVGAHYGFSKGMKSTRGKIAKALRDVNAPLEQFLRSHFFEAEVMRETQELRNTVSHEIPRYTIEVVNYQEDAAKNYRLGLHVHSSSSESGRRKFLFGYMFSAYDHVLKGIAEVVQRLANS